VDNHNLFALKNSRLFQLQKVERRQRLSYFGSDLSALNNSRQVR